MSGQKREENLRADRPGIRAPLGRWAGRAL